MQSAKSTSYFFLWHWKCETISYFKIVSLESFNLSLQYKNQIWMFQMCHQVPANTRLQIFSFPRKLYDLTAYVSRAYRFYVLLNISISDRTVSQEMGICELISRQPWYIEKKRVHHRVPLGLARIRTKRQ